MATRYKSQITYNEANLQHSRAATDNLMQIMLTENIEISFIQEPYIHQNRPMGITTGYRTNTHGEGKSRAAIIITNDTLDAMLITQYSHNDTVLIEIHKGSNIFDAASVYMEYN
jgi:SAM-dependent MidA family methyltransferase